MNLYLYKFSKKANSTLVPDQEQLVLPNIKLKEDTSKQTPTFILNAGALGVDTGYNYAWYNGTWYFIEDYTLRNNNIYEISCVKDVLGTYANQIKASSQYVLRSASEFDGAIVDNYYPIIRKAESRGGVTTDAPFFNHTKYYVIGAITGGTEFSNGSVVYYGMSQSVFNRFSNFLFNDIDWMDISSIEAGLVKGLINPIQYVTSCIALPYTPDIDAHISSGHMSRASRIGLGYWSIPFEGDDLPVVFHQGGVIDTINFHTTIKHHPQAPTRGRYLDLYPYTERVLYFQPFGVFNLDTSKIYGSDESSIEYDGQIIYRIVVCLNDGKAHLYVTSGNGFMLVDSIAQIGINIPISQMNTDISGAVSSVGSAVLGAVTNPVGIISNTMTAIGSVASAMLSPQSQTVGGISSFLFTKETSPTLQSIFNYVADDDNAQFGRPLCKVRTLRTLSGFTICKDASISLEAPRSDIDAVINYLNSGVYIE